MYSGERTTPTILRRCRRPLMTATTESPGRNLWASMNASLASTSPRPGSRYRPLRRCRALRPGGDGGGPPARRLGQAGHVERHVRDDARLDLGDSGDLAETGGQGVRRPLHVGEDVGEAVAVVVGGQVPLQRAERAERHDERGD